MYSTGSNLAIDWSDDEESAPRSPVSRLAGEVQRSWLPDATVSTPHVAVATHSTSVHRCGGDLCAVYPLGEALLVVIGDVTGHHYDAALVCALAKGACDVAASELRPLTASRLLGVLDRTLRTSASGRIAMSCSVAMVASRTMTVASAGHPLPYVLRAGGEQLEGVRSFGNLLGTSVPMPYTTTTVPLRPGDRVLWYTDGVIDAENEARNRFGHRRLRNVLKQHHALGARELVDALAAELFWFRGDAPATDDTSFAVAEIR